MQVNIDLDMVAHELGHLRRKTGEVDEDGKDVLELFPLHEVAPVAKGRVLSIIMGAQAGGWRGWLTRGRNHRHELATIQPYKGHREDVARNNVDKLKDIFHKDLGAIWCDGWEADDAIATEQWKDIFNVGSQFGWDDDTLREYSNVVTATRDKDLDTVPGWKYKWILGGGKDINGELVPEDTRNKKKGDAYWVSIKQAFRNFYKQMLLGDAADNIKGLYGVGEKSVWLSQLDEMDDEEDMYEHVLEKYHKHYGRNYGEKFIRENGKLLHMQRYRGDEWLPPEERDEHYWFLP